ncbi:MAG: (d)CMP kinase, partial [Schleiferiaceae bacterium]
MIIAIDGYSSTGKSSLAKKLAVHFGFLYVDSGAMYR